MIVTTQCRFCGGPIEADAEELNKSVACPHCQQTVFLTDPRTEQRNGSPAPAAAPRTAGAKRQNFIFEQVTLALAWLAGLILFFVGVAFARSDIAQAVYLCGGAILTAVATVGVVLVAMAEQKRS